MNFISEEIYSRIATLNETNDEDTIDFRLSTSGPRSDIRPRKLPVAI
jgi:hypothetical protein